MDNGERFQQKTPGRKPGVDISWFAGWCAGQGWAETEARGYTTPKAGSDNTTAAKTTFHGWWATGKAGNFKDFKDATASFEKHVSPTQWNLFQEKLLTSLTGPVNHDEAMEEWFLAECQRIDEEFWREFGIDKAAALFSLWSKFEGLIVHLQHKADKAGSVPPGLFPKAYEYFQEWQLGRLFEEDSYGHFLGIETAQNFIEKKAFHCEVLLRGTLHGGPKFWAPRTWDTDISCPWGCEETGLPVGAGIYRVCGKCGRYYIPGRTTPDGRTPPRPGDLLPGVIYNGTPPGAGDPLPEACSG